MTIPFPEFTSVIKAYFPECHTQEIMPAAKVHVFDEEDLQEQFWPVWDKIKRAVNEAYKNRPLENSAIRGICDEINKDFIVQLTKSTRQKYGNEDVAPGVLETSVIIPADYALNHVPGYGAHRTAIFAIKTKDSVGWQPKFGESQLTYAQFQLTNLDDAVVAGVDARECWL